MAVKGPGYVCWYLYMVRCHDGSLYTGIATDVERRFGQHQGSGDGGSKYLRGRGPLTLVFQERVGDRSLALKVEAMVKRLSKEKKELFAGGRCGIEALVRRMASR
jgi:putative endonuclease